MREYNATYNYFDGMSDREVADFQKDALTGHRPTWKMAANSWPPACGRAAPVPRGPMPIRRPRRGMTRRPTIPAPFLRGGRVNRAQPPSKNRRQLRPLEKKAMTTLGLKQGATKDEIKARFKELVKLHHPDANGGDTRSEEKLREIIQAYNYLKQAGLV